MEQPCGNNPHQAADKGASITYTWDTYRPPGTNANEPLGAVLLQDMADFRNHRHHGLIGALIIEDRKATTVQGYSWQCYSNKLVRGLARRACNDC
jgi:hypothetical protein